MPAHGAYAGLHQSACKFLLHDSRELAGVREAATLKLVVEIGMRVEMQNREIGKVAMEAAHNRIGDGMIAAQADQRRGGIDRFRNRIFDRGESGRDFRGKLDVTAVRNYAGCAEIDAVLGPHIS
jgi:hypothetical protein